MAVEAMGSSYPKCPNCGHDFHGLECRWRASFWPAMHHPVEECLCKSSWKEEEDEDRAVDVRPDLEEAHRPDDVVGHE